MAGVLSASSLPGDSGTRSWEPWDPRSVSRTNDGSCTAPGVEVVLQNDVDQAAALPQLQVPELMKQLPCSCQRRPPPGFQCAVLLLPWAGSAAVHFEFRACGSGFAGKVLEWSSNMRCPLSDPAPVTQALSAPGPMLQKQRRPGLSRLLGCRTMRGRSRRASWWQHQGGAAETLRVVEGLTC